MLQNGCDTEPKLVFKGQKKLTDVFKQLCNARLLTGCLKQDLQNWIVEIFNIPE